MQVIDCKSKAWHRNGIKGELNLKTEFLEIFVFITNPELKVIV